MTLDDYKTVLYRQEDGSWVAEIPAISGCYALMPSREEALSELKHVFEMVAEEYREQGQALPEDSTEIVNAERHCPRVSESGEEVGVLEIPSDRQP